MSGPWDAATLRSRIADAAHHRRWAAGSPNEREITAYAAAIPADHPRNRALVFGMTPELRQMAVTNFAEVVSIDRSPEAHTLYADWVTPPSTHREHCLELDWLAAPSERQWNADIVFADGIFCNCDDAVQAGSLLNAIRATLAPHGLLITRHVCYPDGFVGMRRSWREVVEAQNTGITDEEEAGFALRLSAFVNDFWNDQNCRLDCSQVYAQLRRLHLEGAISRELYDVSLRYYFAGTNWIPDDQRWQALLARHGWYGHRHELTGKDWYRYYPLYVCGLGHVADVR